MLTSEWIILYSGILNSQEEVFTRMQHAPCTCTLVASLQRSGRQKRVARHPVVKNAGVSRAFISISEYINTIGSEFRSTLISSYLGLGYRSGVSVSYAFWLVGSPSRCYHIHICGVKIKVALFPPWFWLMNMLRCRWIALKELRCSLSWVEFMRIEDAERVMF